jgi:acetylglutamate kinase
MPGKVTLFVVKIGGNIIDDDARLDEFLRLFAALPGAKILVHGGGKLATELAESLGVSQVMIEGRRVTDEATLKIAEMVYGGLVNKQLVAALHPYGCLRQIDFEEFQELKRKEIITRGMIPKLENAFSAIKEGVRRVIIGKAELLPQLIDGTSGTSIIRDRHEHN